MKIGDYVRTKSNGIQKIDEEGRVNLGLIKPPFNIIKKERWRHNEKISYFILIYVFMS